MVWAILGLLASVFESSSLHIEKKTLIKEHAMEFSASMFLFAMLFTIPLWIFSKTHLISMQQIGFVLLSSLFLSLSVFFFAKALRHMATPYTDPFLSFIPLIVAIFACGVLGEVMTLKQWLGILLVSGGSYGLYCHSHKHLFDALKKSIYIAHMKFVVLGILAYSASAILDKKIVSTAYLGLPVLSYIPLLFFFSGVILILMMLMFHDGFKGIENGMINNKKNLSIIAILLILSKSMIAFALAVPGLLVGVLYSVKQVSQIITMLFSGDLFHKDHILRKAAACLLIIVGIVVVLV